MRVLPRILANKERQDQIRVWVAGCATGEEAYSIAMLLAEHAGTALDGPAVQVFATDLDEQAIAAARDALYTNADVADVSEDGCSDSSSASRVDTASAAISARPCCSPCTTSSATRRSRTST